MRTTKSTRLIANTLPPRENRGEARRVVRLTLDKAVPEPRVNSAPQDPADPYRISDRTVDHVVDRLLEELTW